MVKVRNDAPIPMPTETEGSTMIVRIGFNPKDWKHLSFARQRINSERKQQLGPEIIYQSHT
jgi:hypothetical protein